MTAGRFRTARLIVAAGLFAPPAPALAQSPPPEPQEPAWLKSERPAEFDDLIAPREAKLDLFVDGQPLGIIAILIAPGKVRFIDPSALIARLPPLADPGTVLAVLEAPLDSNARLSCTPSPQPGCGRLAPDIAGVILSRDANRIDLFLSVSMRGAAHRTLADPLPGPATLAGALGLDYGLSRRGIDFTLRPRTVLGFGRSHVAIDATFSNRISTLDRAYFRRTGNRYQISAGLLSATPYTFIFFDRFVGLSFASTIDTRLERSSISDTPLILDAPLPGRVEILRDGMLIETQRIEPGRVTLDTGQLPGGAYPLTLRVIDGSGERTELRFFARDGGLPPYGESQFFVEAGANAALRGLDNGFLPHFLSPVMRAGINHRAGPQLGLQARIEAGSARQLIEAGAAWLIHHWRLGGTIAATADGDYAGALNVSGNIQRINWSLQARLVETHGTTTGLYDPERGLGRSYRQVSAFGGWNRNRFSLNMGFIWRSDPPGRSSYSILPSARWMIGQGRGRRWELETSGSASRDSWTARIGLRLSRFGGRSSTTLSAGSEARHNAAGTTIRPIARGDWGTSLDSDWGPLSLRAGASQEFDRLSGRAGANLTTTWFRSSLDAQIEENFDASSLYGRFDTAFGLAGGRFAFGSDAFTGAGIIAEAPGAPKDARFSVRAVGAGGRPIRGDDPVFVSTSPFTQGSIGLNAIGGAASFDTRSEPAIFYPGTVKHLIRKSNRITVIYARIVDAAGAPVGNATVDADGGIAESSAHGGVQIEVTSGSILVVRREDGGACTVTVPKIDEKDLFKDVGELICTIADPAQIANPAD